MSSKRNKNSAKKNRKRETHMNNVEDVVREIILSNLFNSNETNITPETNLVKDIGMDSISLMMMVVSIENKFNIELPDEFLTEESLSKFSNIVTIVEELLKNKNI